MIVVPLVAGAYRKSIPWSRPLRKASSAIFHSACRRSRISSSKSWLERDLKSYRAILSLRPKVTSGISAHCSYRARYWFEYKVQTGARLQRRRFCYTWSNPPHSKNYRCRTFTYKAILPDPDISGLNRQTGKSACFQYSTQRVPSKHEKDRKTGRKLCQAMILDDEFSIVKICI